MRYKLFATGECRNPVFMGAYPTLEACAADIDGVDRADGKLAGTWPEGHDATILDIETGQQYGYMEEGPGESMAMHPCDRDPEITAIYQGEERPAPKEPVRLSKAQKILGMSALGLFKAVNGLGDSVPPELVDRNVAIGTWYEQQTSVAAGDMMVGLADLMTVHEAIVLMAELIIAAEEPADNSDDIAVLHEGPLH